MKCHPSFSPLVSLDIPAKRSYYMHIKSGEIRVVPARSCSAFFASDGCTLGEHSPNIRNRAQHDNLSGRLALTGLTIVAGERCVDLKREECFKDSPGGRLTLR